MSKECKKKVLLIGLDSMPDSQVFHERKADLPNLRKMMDNGIFATLKSCHPPITIPAWMVMMSSKTPGKLGVYGFKHRKGCSYTDSWLTTSTSFKEDRVWDILEKYNKKSCLIGVPPTYPPIKVYGNLVSCFVTPKNKTSGFTYPDELSTEINNFLNEPYLFDIKFRVVDRDAILEDLYKMAKTRFKVIKYLLKNKQWDFSMFVEIGLDRLHHMFWKYYDKSHPRYEPNSKYQNTIPDYYKFLDDKIGELLEIIDDDTYVITVSDHGTASMKGAFCVNEWLIKEGYLVLKNYPSDIRDITKCDVDWSKTTAWGWGGYYARIFFNIQGRETDGTISFDKLDQVKKELEQKILNIKGPNGEDFDNKVVYPEQLYDEVNGAKPDMMVYFDNLYWRSAGTLGHSSLYLSENDTGPDDSVHWWDGMFIMYNKKNQIEKGKRLNELSIYDIAPIILDILNVEIPSDMTGMVPQEIQNYLRQENMVIH